MKQIILLALLLPTFVFAQGVGLEAGMGLEDRVEVIEGEQNVQNDRIDDLENSPRAVPDINELNSIQSNLVNAHFDTREFGHILFSCNQYQVFGCDQAHSSVESFSNFRYDVRTASVRFRDRVRGPSGRRAFVFGVPTDMVLGGSRASGFDDLRFVSHANVASFKNFGQTLVDDCDNPTVALIDRNRNPRVTRIPLSIMDNAGRTYENVFFDPPFTLVDVTGRTFGVLNFIVHGDTTTPICTPGVSDRTGIWEQYSYTFVLDTNDPRFAGPYTYTGTIGLLDRVEALENP